MDRRSTMIIIKVIGHDRGKHDVLLCIAIQCYFFMMLRTGEHNLEPVCRIGYVTILILFHDAHHAAKMSHKVIPLRIILVNVEIGRMMIFQDANVLAGKQ